MQNSRSEILRAVHTCLLTHFGGVNADASSAMQEQPAPRSSRAASNGRNGVTTPGGQHSNGSLHALSEVCLAHVKAIQVCSATAESVLCMRIRTDALCLTSFTGSAP